MRVAGVILGLGLLLQAPIVRRPPMKPVEPDADSQQQPVQQEQVPTIRVQTRLVNVAVNVVDKTGAPVGGLEKDDFEIAEDGNAEWMQSIAVAVNQEYARAADVLRDGDEVALLPPVSGGVR